MAKREVRIRQLPNRFDGKHWLTTPQRVVWLGDVGRWSVVRAADYRNAAPFVMSRKDWDALPVEARTTPNQSREM